MHPVLALVVMVPLGWLGGLVAARLRLPRITGYLVVGAVLSPSLLGVVPRSTVDDLNVVAVAALGMIGYAIGGSVQMDSLRSLGSSIAWITVAQGMVAWGISTAVIVALGPWILDVPGATVGSVYLPVAIVLGAIAWLTAPAVTIALIRELRAAGPLTTTSLSVVALSDVGGIVAFALSIGLAHAMMGDGLFSPMDAFAWPVIDVAGAIMLGVAAGFGMRLVARPLPGPPLAILGLVLVAILLCTWLASVIGVSTVLACMVMGFVAVNFGGRLDLVAALTHVEEWIFILFFVLSGMYFDWSAMEAAGWLAAVIFITRSAGKYAGAYLGARVAGASLEVRRYVGISLLPKAGLTIGMAFLVLEEFPGDLGELMFNGLLAATVINMLVTPPLVKRAFVSSREQGRAVEAS